MKNNILLILAFFLFSNLVSGQDDYTVIKVNGTIIIKTKGVSLETGTIFSGKEDLLFKTNEATAAVINPVKGRMVLTSENNNLAIAKSNFLPAMYNISSRAGALVNLIDLQNHFKGKYVIVDKLKLPVSSKNYPMDAKHFFFLRYKYKGEDINKKLSFLGDSLIIDKKSLYAIDGSPIPNPDYTLIKLFYRKGVESELISEFDLIFPDSGQLKNEVQIIINGMKDKTTKEKIGEITSYINEFYGKPEQENLSKWLYLQFGLKSK
jgi:hypothetical protein